MSSMGFRSTAVKGLKTRKFSQRQKFPITQNVELIVYDCFDDTSTVVTSF